MLIKALLLLQLLFANVTALPIELLKFYSIYNSDPPTSHNELHRGSRKIHHSNKLSIMLLTPIDDFWNSQNELAFRDEEEFDAKPKSRRAKIVPVDEVRAVVQDPLELVSKDAKTKKATIRRPVKPNRIRVKNGNKQDQVTDNDDVIVDEEEDHEQPGDFQEAPVNPQNNNMSGQSQIGNRESQMVIKPTVILNFRGSVSNTDSDIKLTGRNRDEQNSTSRSNRTAIPPQSIFNINQEVNIPKTYTILEEEETPLRKHKKNAPIIEARSDSELGEPIDLMKIKVDDVSEFDEFATENYTEDVDEEKKGKSKKSIGIDDDLPVVLSLNQPYVFTIGPLGGFLNV